MSRRQEMEASNHRAMATDWREVVHYSFGGSVRVYLMCKLGCDGILHEVILAAEPLVL